MGIFDQYNATFFKDDLLKRFFSYIPEVDKTRVNTDDTVYNFLNRSEPRLMDDQATGTLGRYTVRHGIDIYDGKEYPYVAYSDIWDNPGATKIGAKSPQIYNKIYYDKSKPIKKSSIIRDKIHIDNSRTNEWTSFEPLNPQPTFGVDPSYKKYVDSLNAEYLKNLMLKEYEWKPNWIGRMLERKSQSAQLNNLKRWKIDNISKPMPYNQSLYYAFTPWGWGNHEDIKASFNRTMTGEKAWDGKAGGTYGFDDIPAVLWALQLGVGRNQGSAAAYRKTPGIAVSYYKPRGHTGKDVQYYWKLEPGTDQMYLDNYFRQLNLYTSQEDLDKARSFHELSEKNEIFRNLRPSNYDKPLTNREVHPDYGEQIQYINYMNDTANEDLFGKHWYSPEKIKSGWIALRNML